ncbi:hypothetical protein NHX12_008825 [Muraenolepis orangiensis]|uniref:Death domain-containing protein n=1 Tax=Muraenolepis orangiensis TaxID=630683 RepID=A0A9Q0I8E8_9TELE|nr:hypothetical protein NHX12_008825 [Muraenolepis orangiensis]
MPVIKGLLDDLWQKKVLSTEDKDSVMENQTSKVDKARCLIDMVMGKGDRASQMMVDSLMDRDGELWFSLGLIPSPDVLRGQDLSDKQLLRVAETLGQEWEQAAIHLKLNITDLDTIKAERQWNVSMQKLKMLVLWKNRSPRGEATAQHLLRSLEDLQDLSRDARQILEDMMKE